MARVSKRRHPHLEPHSPLGRLMEEHLEWLLINNYSEDTADHARWAIADFIRWAELRGLQHPMEVTRPILESYQRYLYYYRKGDGQPLTFRTQHSRLTPVRRWFRWLVRNNHILHNPASDLDLPRMEKRLPKTILSADEVEHVMVVPDIKTPVGLRDRAMLETFYSSGRAAQRTDPPQTVRPGPRARHADGAPGQGQKRSHDPDRRAGAGLGGKISA